eukprot:GHVR01109159.1.p2 GENE.GHVR01109159.1~~GHVR01109159.1.p2  ORF type:complete len:113 (+),score=29.03 GHVR01109159.1:683-1021(+)
MSNLKCLYFIGNNIVGQIQSYRKTMIGRLQQLSYLDDRPVSHREKVACLALLEGGKEAEMEARRRYNKEEELRMSGVISSLREAQDKHREKMRRALERIDRCHKHTNIHIKI